MDYQEPVELQAEIPPPDYRLFSARAVGVIAFLGTSLGGGYALAMNFRRLGDDEKARNTLLVSAVVFIAMTIAAFLLPESVPASAFTVPVPLIYGFLASNWQGEAIKEHQANGGRLVPKWRSFLVSVVAMLLALVVIFSGVYAAEGLSGLNEQSIDFNQNDAVYYEDGVSPEVAQTIGNVLTEEYYFGFPEGSWAEVRVDDDTLVVALFMIARD